MPIKYLPNNLILAVKFILQSPDYSYVHTTHFKYWSLRTSGVRPRFERINKYSPFTSGQLLRSFSTSTLPMKPVAPVISIFLPAYQEATCDFSSSSSFPICSVNVCMMLSLPLVVVYFVKVRPKSRQQRVLQIKHGK